MHMHVMFIAKSLVRGDPRPLSRSSQQSHRHRLSCLPRCLRLNMDKTKSMETVFLHIVRAFEMKGRCC